jgi:EAL domain-containing protein (putative c-di-GMP-specific phosphodiesterase class I)
VAVANSLIGVLNNYHYERDGHSITIGCSIGISLIDGSHTTGSEHLVQADKASFVAKNRGRNLVHAYDPRDRDSEDLRRSIDWAHRIRLAISEDRLELYIQPILEVASGNINHFEALLRLRPADSTGTIAPGVFISALEKAGQIHILDRWVIRRSIALLSRHAHLAQLAVNLSGRAFADPELLPFIKDQLKTHAVDPSRVIFEITETASVANINQTQRMIQQLRRLGCHFALDDFGTGFCSFHYLRHLPADYLKIDGSYIRNIADSDLDRTMVRSMNEIAHQLGKKTIAECVESQEVLAYLKSIGVDYVQGHIIGQAAPIAG